MKMQKGFGAVEGLIVVVVIAVIGLGAFFLLNQDSDDDMDDSMQNQQTIVQESSDDFPLSLTFENLEPLPQGVYEGWVVRDDVKYSFGTFNTTESGSIDGEFMLEGITPQEGDTVAISIEPEDDPDPEPSATIVLAGEVRNGMAELAFPVDVSGFSGTYILATPTTSTTDDETSGVWFTVTGLDASLNLPVAPEGWIYEGWVVFDGMPLTTGQFTDPAQADLFDGYSGPGNAPDKPGEDFIQNLPNGLTGPLELADGTSVVVISLEPYQNGTDPTGPTPAQVKPLTHTIPANSQDHSALSFDLSTSSLPSGTAMLEN